jgi:hypothetical protein
MNSQNSLGRTWPAELSRWMLESCDESVARAIPWRYNPRFIFIRRDEKRVIKKFKLLPQSPCQCPLMRRRFY